MMLDLTLPILRHLAVCACITAGWVLLWYAEPYTANALSDLIEHHLLALGTTGVLIVICIDARLVALRTAVSQRGVGVKSKAQAILGARR